MSIIRIWESAWFEARQNELFEIAPKKSIKTYEIDKIAIFCSFFPVFAGSGGKCIEIAF